MIPTTDVFVVFSSGSHGAHTSVEFFPLFVVHFFADRPVLAAVADLVVQWDN